MTALAPLTPGGPQLVKRKWLIIVLGIMCIVCFYVPIYPEVLGCFTLLHGVMASQYFVYDIYMGFILPINKP